MTVAAWLLYQTICLAVLEQKHSVLTCRTQPVARLSHLALLLVCIPLLPQPCNVHTRCCLWARELSRIPAFADPDLSSGGTPISSAQHWLPTSRVDPRISYHDRCSEFCRTGASHARIDYQGECFC